MFKKKRRKVASYSSSRLLLYCNCSYIGDTEKEATIERERKNEWMRHDRIQSNSIDSYSRIYTHTLFFRSFLLLFS